MLYTMLLNRFSHKLPVRLQWFSSSSNYRGKKYINKRQRTTYEPINMEEHSSLLSRVTVVDNVEQSKMVVEKILDLGQPVAVDMEGVAEGVTSMIQVCDSERNISLFRTGLNPRLYWEGGLARILESPLIMKIMHAASVDCLSVYKDGVKLWNLYDTCIAHRVLEYQINGRSLYSSPQIGFNPLCNYCGLPENTMKERFQDILWKMIIPKNGKIGLTTAKELQDDVILYCALDVEPLHEIHSILSSLVAPDYSYLVTQLSEVAIIRAINPDLAKRKRKSLQNIESCNIFLSQLRPNTNKPNLYSKLSSLNGLTHIYYSDIHNTANIILESRSATIKATSQLTDLIQGQIRLMDKIQPTEILEDQGKVLEVMDDEVTTIVEIRTLVDSLVAVGSPVVIDFHLYTNCSTLELYYGQLPSIKMLLTKEMLEEGGLGLLMSSPNVVKVIYRLDVSSVQAALKIFSQHGVEIHNVFEIDGGVKMIDYADHGLSIFKSQSRNIQAVVNSLGLYVEGSGRSFRLDWYYLTYLHLVNIMGDKLKSLLAEKIKLEVDIGYGEVTAKDKRKILRKRFDDFCVHIRYSCDKESLRSLVMRTLLARDILLIDYVDLMETALVFLDNKEAVKTTTLDLVREQTNLGITLTVTSPTMDNLVPEKSSKSLVDVGELVKLRDLNVVKVIGLNESPTVSTDG